MVIPIFYNVSTAIDTQHIVPITGTYKSEYGSATYINKNILDNKLRELSYDISRKIEHEFIKSTNDTSGLYGGNNCSYTGSTAFTTSTGPSWSRTYDQFCVVATPQSRLRQMMQSRQAPLVLGTRKPLGQDVSQKEQRARDTLKRLVGEAQYRRFLAHGFITARGKSGKVYQIEPGHHMTCVYSPTGQFIEKLCVVLRGNFPPTDELITRFLMILNDEDGFRSLANVMRGGYHKPVVLSMPDDSRPLPEIFKELKRQAA